MKLCVPLLSIHGHGQPVDQTPVEQAFLQICDIRKPALNLIRLSTSSQLIGVHIYLGSLVTLAIKYHRVQAISPLAWLSYKPAQQCNCTKCIIINYQKPGEPVA